MTLRILFLVVFVGSLALLGYQLKIARARRSKGEATPSYAAGNIAGSLAMLVLSGSNLIVLSKPFRIIAACIAILLVGAEFVIYVRALRRESRRAI